MPDASSPSTPPRHAPNITALPGELLLHVVRHAMTPDEMEQETLQAYLERGLTLKLVSKKFAKATAQHLQHHLHAYGTPLPIASEKQLWHPQSNSIELRAEYWGTMYGQKYWDQFPDLAMTKHALSLTKVPSVRTLSLDLRHKRGQYELRSNGVRASNGPNITHILTRLIESAHNISELNLRISPDRETLRAVEQLLRTTPTLRHVNIEIDQAQSRRRPQVVFRLSQIVDETQTYQSFEHFVLRCPDMIVVCHHDRPSRSSRCFLSRFRHVKHFGICARQLKSHTYDWLWLWRFWSCTPELQVCQFAVDIPSGGRAPSRISNVTPRTLRHLTDLTLEVPGIDTGLFRQLSAHRLSHLRFRTNVDVEDWPQCKFLHFPSLQTVDTWCHGPSALRLTLLGVPFCKFWRNLRAHWHSYDHFHVGWFSATLHGPTWAPFNLVMDDHDVTIFDLPLPKMEEGEKRRFDIPVGKYKLEGESVLEGPPYKRRRLCLFSTKLLTL
ncbi:hypothetical protein OC844_006762 [Tilletia horrida]|nr:hypothetical protein OC844_006762 [Tilletia horrida]